MASMPSVNDVKAWYNEHYAAKGLESMRPAQAYTPFLDLLAVGSGARLLDVSCGSGFLLAAAQARGAHAVGVDLSHAAIRMARRVAPKAILAVGAGEHLTFRDGTFDFVTCLGSLEHFLDMGQGLREMLRVAKPAARFCIMVPNENFIGWKVLGHQGTAQQDINERLLPLPAWRRLFEEHGLEVARVTPDLWHAVKWRVPGVAASPIRFLTGPLLEVAWRLVPLAWQYQFVFVLQRRSTRPSAARSRPS
jgi:SAM-dependent methyltransferase